MRLMPVTVPEPPRRRTDATAVRLARHVALLFGVDWPTNPRRCTWLCDYEALTLAEIGRGAPLPTREWHKEETAATPAGAGPKATLGQSARFPAGTWRIVDRALIEGIGTPTEATAATSDANPDVPPDAAPEMPESHALPGVEVEAPEEIAPATLNRFGPDRKAAAVLVGANALFDPLVAVINDVVTMLGTLDTGRSVAPVIRVVLWAHLVQQIYRSEPVLFAAAVQARAIQRALVTEVSLDLVEPLPTARCELGNTDTASWADADAVLTPRTLNVLDHTFKALKLDYLGDMMSEASHGYLADDIVDRWTKYLLHSRDRGLLWAREASPGRRRGEVFAPVIGLANSLVDDMLGVLPQLLASEETDASEPGEHGWSHLLPRLPSPGELMRFDTVTQRSAIWALVHVYRLLRENQHYGSPGLEESVGRCAQRLADLATRVLGPADPVTHVALARSAAFSLMDYRATDLDVALAAAGEFICSLLSLQSRFERGAAPPGSPAEQLWALAGPLHIIAADLTGHGRDADAAVLYEQLTSLWDVFFAVLHVDLEEELSADAVSDRVLELSPHLHNYAAMLMTTPDPATRERGIRIQERLVLPARRQIAVDRRCTSPLRVALQVLVRGMCRHAQLLTGAGREERAAAVVRAASEHVEAFSALPQIRVRLDPSYRLRTPRGAAALVCLLDGWFTLLEHGIESPHIDLDTAQRAIGQVEAFGDRPHEHETTFSTYVLSEPVAAVSALRARLEDIRRVG